MKKETLVLAPDSFKESMTAKEVYNAMEKGLRKVFPEANFVHVLMADGGEGTTQSLIDATRGTLYALNATGPLGETVEASYGIMGNGEIAVIEIASASGIQFVNRDTKNPLVTTTYGTGELIRSCLDKGIKKIILGIGGSATNNGGAGRAEALGVRFYDEAGNALPRGGGALDRLHHINFSGLDSRLAQVDIQVACDVTNPLCRVPGAGAAGGLGAGLMAFTQCTLRRSIDIVVEFRGLSDKLVGVDFCFTGEGRIDYQTKFGKTPYGIARTAKAQGVPVIAVSGCVGEGIDTIFGIITRADNIEALLKDGPINMERACENIGRLLKNSSIIKRQ